MSNQQMEQAFPPDVCQRCGGKMNIALFITIEGKGKIAGDGEVVIFDVDKPYIEDVPFYKCKNCGAFDEDTGLKLSLENDLYYLRPIEDQLG